MEPLSLNNSVLMKWDEGWLRGSVRSVAEEKRDGKRNAEGQVNRPVMDLGIQQKMEGIDGAVSSPSVAQLEEKVD